MKKVEMERVLRCADVSGTSCQFVARAQTMEEILELAGRHAVESHGLAVAPARAAAVARGGGRAATGRAPGGDGRGAGGGAAPPPADRPIMATFSESAAA